MAPMMACRTAPMPLTMAIRQAPMVWRMDLHCLFSLVGRLVDGGGAWGVGRVGRGWVGFPKEGREKGRKGKGGEERFTRAVGDGERNVVGNGWDFWDDGDGKRMIGWEEGRVDRGLTHETTAPIVSVVALHATRFWESGFVFVGIDVGFL